nr:vesicle-fusing atpase [Quercus suber]
MIVTNTPAADLALTNLAYCSHADLHGFAVPGTKLYLASIADSFVLSLTYPFLSFLTAPFDDDTAHESVRNGHIALNAIQRRHARVSSGDTISVNRFIPPENFDLALLSLELEFVKKGTKSEQVDAILLASQLKKIFKNQVMTAGQRVSFEFHGNNYIFTVNQAATEGQEKSSTIERGMISRDTYIVFETSNASGIKIVNQREAASSNIFRQKEFNLQSLVTKTSTLSELGDEEAGSTDKGIGRLTNPERRAKLKKQRKEAKKLVKELEKVEEVQQTPQAAVLAEVKEDLIAEEAFENKKRKLAELGMALLANPEPNIKSLKEMLQISKDNDHAIAKLGVLSMLAVFKDIIKRRYRIRLPTEKDLEMKVSKDVKKMRFYESTLLSAYKVGEKSVLT